MAVHNPGSPTFWSIPRKLALLLFVVFLSASAILIASGFSHRSDQIRDAEKSALLLAQSLAAQQEQIAIGTKQMLSTLSYLPEVRGMNTAACNELFRQLQIRNPIYSMISASTPEGNIFASSLPLETGVVNLFDRKHFRDVLKTLEFSAGEYVVGRVSEVPSLHYSYPVLDSSNNLIAVVSAAFRLEAYSRFIENVDLPGGAVVVITDHAGVRLFRMPESSLAALGKRIPEVSYTDLSGDAAHGTFWRLAEDGVKRVYAFNRLCLTEGSKPYLYMVAGIAEDEIVRGPNLNMVKDILLLGLACFVAIGLTWLFGHLVFIMPLNRLVEAARRFGGGDLRVRTGLSHSADELGQLAASFDAMASELEARDTERRKAEQALLESERQVRHDRALLRAVIDSIPDLIFFKDTNSVFLGCNKAFKAYSGLDEDELAGKTDLDIAPRDLAESSLLKDREMLASGKPRSNEEWVPFKNGGGGYFDTLRTPYHGPDGELLGLIGVSRDITERKRGEEEKEKLEIQLFHAQKMESVGRLAGGVAHDFNNMLGVIIGHSELALNRIGPDEAVHHHLIEILKAARRSADFTRQLLAFARKQTVSPKVLDLNDTISGMLKMLQKLIGEDIDLIWNPGHELWKVRMDPSQVDQILANLAANARDAILGVGSVSIRTENVSVTSSRLPDRPGLTAGDYVLLTVRDTGEGMDGNTLEHLFEPFFTTKEFGRGTGLGLATVYGIIKQNAGFIYVESKPVQGAVFRIYLPRFASERVETIENQAEETPKGGSETILLVEDDESMLDLSKTLLENLGYRVFAAKDPREAIHLFESCPGEISLLLTDVVMPAMNGRELAEKITALRPDLQTLFMSGYTAEVIAKNGVLDKGMHFIHKPFRINELAIKIREVLQKK